MDETELTSMKRARRASSVDHAARRHLSWLLPPLAGACLAALTPTVAQAGPNDNSASRPWSLHAGLGPAVSFGGHVMGRVHFDMEYHFKGGDVGPALGFYVPFNFDEDDLGLNIGPIFLWDFRIAQAGSAKVYLGPMVATGYGFHADVDGGAFHFFFFHGGAHFRMLWRDRIGFFARPANFEVWAGRGVVGHWSFIAGLAAAF